QLDYDSSLRVPDPHDNPEESAMFHQRNTLIQQVLGEMTERDREILMRFYIYEQPQDQICAEMELTDTQFRLLKSRAKARFGDLGKKRFVQQKGSTQISLRTSAGSSH